MIHQFERPDMFDKLKKKTCLSLFTYCGHDAYLKRSLQSIAPLKMFTIVTYHSHSGRLPPPDVTDLADVFVRVHPMHGGVAQTWLTHMKYQAGIIQQFDFDYIFNMSGDCILEKPAGINTLIKMMGSDDIIAYWYAYNPRTGYGRIGTMAWLMRVKAFIDIAKESDIIWDDLKLAGGKAEEKAAKSAFRKGYTLAFEKGIEQHQFDYRLPPDQRGLFGDIVGLRHLQWEDRIKK